jgi:hypothetical protein
MKVTTYSQIKDGVTLLKDVTALTLSASKDKVELKRKRNTTKRKQNVLKNSIANKINVRDTQWQTASKVARTTAKVTATCAIALVGGLFAAIIAD